MKDSCFSSIGSLIPVASLLLVVVCLSGKNLELHLSSFGTLNTNSDAGTGGTVLLAGNHLFGRDVGEISSVLCCIHLYKKHQHGYMSLKYQPCRYNGCWYNGCWYTGTGEIQDKSHCCYENFCMGRETAILYSNNQILYSMCSQIQLF